MTSWVTPSFRGVLGDGLVSNDGRVDSELSRRLGLAAAEFRKLKRAWNHANLSRRQKLDFFESFVVSKLKYGLCTAGLVKAQRRRLDGFHARCLRRILGVPAAFVSRVSNAEVFSRAVVRPITEQLTEQQLMLMRRVGRSPAGSPLRRNTLVGGTANPVIGSFIRRVGRPRQDWTTQVLSEATRRCGSGARMDAALLDTTAGADQRWKSLMGFQRRRSSHCSISR